MNYYSYVLYNQEHHRFYYGFCMDLKKAVQAHNQGKVELTADYSNWVILYNEGFHSKQEAIRRSRFYRSVAGQRYLKNILNY
ncbi:GIY-YIG nuclease family protein [Sunxiuqinia elliptica]|uniref:Putative endonuclease n=1 Tax=Sunxiuqinia elliptica TaxID=655355 RepID=A0A4R6H4X9_9BACT|nr:GIY-YIG nuclease family protein [Sunxiuqinia elliptica]TDO02798.1 putative endonuclease [Sunxiuqinia elliptica]TDO58463.1 putative endonuclease [Sunxiuqinia elliptica]